MAYDKLFEHLGSYGPHQRNIHLLLCLTGIIVGFHRLIGVFLQAVPEYRCLLPFELNNATFYVSNSHSNISVEWRGCKYIGENYTSSTLDTLIPCTDWLYDDSVYESSVVTEWNLICEQADLLPLSNSLFMAGDMLGASILGALSDRIGRKPTLLLSIIGTIICGIATAFVPSYTYYLICRLLVGAFSGAAFVIAYVMSMELVGPDNRLLSGLLIEFFWVSGYILTALLAFLLRNWRNLQLAVTLPGILLLSYYWLVPESARWLAAKGKIEKAKSVLKIAAHKNKKELPEAILDDVLKNVNSEDKQNESSFMDLLRFPNLRKKTIVIFISWFAISAVYYWISWNTSQLGGDDYINFSLAGLVELPAYIFLWFSLDKYGRKPIISGCMVLCGCMLIAISAIPQDLSWLILTLALIGKFGVAASFSGSFIYSSELFPTIVRNIGIGSSSTSARFGGLVSPYINLLSKWWYPLPYIINASLIIVSAGLVILFLPETLNHELSDSIQHGESFGKKIGRNNI